MFKFGFWTLWQQLQFILPVSKRFLMCVRTLARDSLKYLILLSFSNTLQCNIKKTARLKESFFYTLNLNGLISSFFLVFLFLLLLLLLLFHLLYFKGSLFETFSLESL